MDCGKQAALDGIDRAVAWVRERHDTGYAPLSARYLQHIAQVACLTHIVRSKDTANRDKDRLFLSTHEEALRQMLGDE